MLQNIRDRAQGVIAWVIILLISFTFAIWGIHNYISDGSKTGKVAEVNGEKITQAHFDKAYQQLKREAQLQLGANFNTMASSLEPQLRQQALENLISDALLTRSAYQAGFRIIPDQVQNVLLHLPILQVNNQFSPIRFQSLLNNMNMNPDEFLQSLRNDMLIGQVQSVFNSSAFSLPNETEAYIQLQKQQRDFSYVTVAAADYRSQIKISAHEIQQYYDKNREQFKSPMKVSIEYIELNSKTLAERLQPTAQQMQSFYQTNIENFSKPARWHVAQILIKVDPHADVKTRKQLEQKAYTLYQQLEQGADFTKLAQTHSDDIANKEKGGDLGWLRAEALGQPFVEILKKSTQPGTLLKPMAGQYGYSLVKVLAYQAGEVSPLSSDVVKTQVIKMWREQEAQRAFAEKSEQLSELTYSNSDTLQVASTQLGLPIKTTAFFSQAEGVDELSKDAKVRQTAFSADVLKQRYNSNAIQLNDTTLVVLRIKDVQMAKQLDLATVKMQIDNVSRSQKTNERVAAVGQQLLAQAANLSKAATSLHLNLQNATGVTRDASKLDNEIINAVFQLSPTRPTSGITLKNGDYIVILLKAVNTGHADAKFMEQAKQQMLQRLGQFDYWSYLRGVRVAAKVKVNKEAFKAEES